MADETETSENDGTADHIAGNEIDTSHDKVNQVDLQLEMQRSYLDYAMSVIVGRALPEVRDGLKPVHRRVIYAMYDGGYRPDKGFSKCTRVIGVSIIPGCTEFTRIPFGPSSSAADLVIPRIANLVPV